MIHYITTHGIGNAWVAAELQIMQKKGIPISLHSLYKPHQIFFGSEWAKQIDRTTQLLYPLPKARFLFSLLLAPFLFGTAFWCALSNAVFGPRESLNARLRTLFHFFVACHWARGLRKQNVSLIHAQWIHSAGSVGMYGAWLLRVPFSFTGHAADLFRDRVALVDKIRRADFIVCISEFHREFYIELGAKPDKLHLVYCGIDPQQFLYRERTRTIPPRILSVGRLVEKKGFPVLLDACSLLKKQGYSFACIIAGNGPQASELAEKIKTLNLEDCVELPNKAVPQEDLPTLLMNADIFVQSCVWSKDNDVDGTPRTLMEAMATGLPCIASQIAGLPDLVDEGKAGMLVEPGNARELANALKWLLIDEDMATEFGRRGRDLVEQKFDIEQCLEPLANIFRWYLPGSEKSNTVTLHCLETLR